MNTKKELLLRYEMSFEHVYHDGNGTYPQNGRAEYLYRMVDGHKEDAINGMLGEYALSIAKVVPSYSETGKPALQALIYDTKQHKTVFISYIADEKTVDNISNGRVSYKDFASLVAKKLAKAPDIDKVVSSFRVHKLLNEDKVYYQELFNLEQCLKRVYKIGRNLETTNKDIRQLMQMFTEARQAELQVYQD